MADFERAIISAVGKVYDQSVMKGCFFHFRQAIWRSIQKCGLQGPYAADAEYALNLRMLAALSFVPEDHVVAAYTELTSSRYYTDNAEEWDGILEYFERTWVGTLNRRNRRSVPLFPVGLWNHYETTLNHAERTNNSVEGWHNGFRNRAVVAHVNTWKFIDLLRDCQSDNEIVIEQLLAGRAAANRRRYRDHDQRIFNVVQQFDPANILEYLRGVAQNLAF
uniref:MULE transposase domain-containing protein n=1 Tax=Glyptapanteles indiensis TaxID=92994 RepID=B7S945_GLYIN|nr:hypothetical protein GIP_L8_0340 [Glyptapanteles indiensis]